MGLLHFEAIIINYIKISDEHEMFLILFLLLFMVRIFSGTAQASQPTSGLGSTPTPPMTLIRICGYGNEKKDSAIISL